MNVLGIDTSNYTTSLSIVNEGGFVHTRRILDVKKGECGLRQSDALFLHTVNLPELFPALFSLYEEKFGERARIDAVAYSARPRDVCGSYMPCFLAGASAASAVASSLGVPLMSFSHQAGHIKAAMMSLDKAARESIGDEFLALHLSGGTTELVYALREREHGYAVEIIAESADISAGQLVDRTGVMLGLKFPCGNELEALAKEAGNADGIRPLKTSVKDGRCNLSGAENRVASLVAAGEDKGKIAYFVLDFIAKNIAALTEYAREKKGALPVLYAGGVMRNGIIKEKVAANFDDVFFSSPELSSDNSVGTAYLGLEKMMRGGGV